MEAVVPEHSRTTLEGLWIGRHVHEAAVESRDVNESRGGAVGHRLPVVAAERAGGDERGLSGGAVAGLWLLDRTSALWIEAIRPRDVHVRRPRDERAGGAIEHVAVPVFAGRRLKVPDVLARVGADGDDRGEKQIVALAVAPHRVVPRPAVADADVEQIEIGIVSHRMPDRAATAVTPPLAVPGLRDHLDGLALEAVLRAAGHRVEAPGHRAGLGVIGRDVPTHAEVGASVADDHLALHDSGRAADGVVLRLLDGERLPHLLPRLRIERDQPAVEGADVDLARPGGDAAVDHVAASLGAVRSGDLRIELPQELAGPGVEGEHVAPGTWLQAPVVYITPSTTIGVASTPRAVRLAMSCDHARPNWPTLAVVIFASGLKRCSPYVRPWLSQF